MNESLKNSLHIGTLFQYDYVFGNDPIVPCVGIIVKIDPRGFGIKWLSGYFASKEHQCSGLYGLDCYRLTILSS